MAKAIFALLEEPHPHDSKELKGYPGFYRKDSGEYRIIYGVDEDTVIVDVLDKRNDDDVYRRLARKRG